MADYITATEFKIRHNITSITDGATVIEVITEASRWVDSMTGRRFDADSVATAREFHPSDSCTVWLTADALEITAVATDTADDGTYGTSWTSTDYQLLPLNGVGPNMQTGWPYTRIEAIESLRFPTGHRRAAVRVTAKWGWATVPADVKGATYMLANRLYEERKAPFGTTGNADFGALPIRDQRSVLKLLAPYMRREPVIV